jgi:type IV secretion system protein VirD4
LYKPPNKVDPLHFLSSVSNTLNDKTTQLVVPFADLLDELTPPQLDTFLDKHFPGKPKLLGSALKFGAGLFAPHGVALAAVSHQGEKFMHTRNVGKIRKLLPRFTIRRPILSLDDKELALIRGMAQLAAQGATPIAEWNRFLAYVSYGDGRNAQLHPDNSIVSDPRMREAQALIPRIFADTFPPYSSILAEAGNRILALRPASATSANTSLPGLTDGARFMTRNDFTADASLSLQRSPASLVVGFTDDDQKTPVYFNGNESLITIASSGAGKTSSQVIRNLLTYPGSAIVLDVKGELWDQTAGHRAKIFGPVYRFSPTNADHRSHRFNPFDFISGDPMRAPSDCGVFSYQVIADKPDLKDPYWENRARNFLWAFATTIALSAPKSSRNLAQIARYLSLDTRATTKNRQPVLSSETEHVLQLMQGLADKHGIDDLRAAALAIRNGINDSDSDRLESVFDTARSHISAFAREPFAQRAMSSSDWSPLDLRNRPGTTVYIALPIDDVPSYAPILRLIFFQHMRLLLNHQAKPNEPPITFFLDEMPQLGNFKSILQLQATGRSAGVRLWMFAQNIRQLKEAYGLDAGEGIPEDARVRCYMQPDEQLAAAISKRLGETNNMFTGQSRPLATAADLAGPDYAHKTVVFSRGSHPAVLRRRGAYEDLQHLVSRPPPVAKLFA